jgi:hypothetical protein
MFRNRKIKLFSIIALPIILLLLFWVVSFKRKECYGVYEMRRIDHSFPIYESNQKWSLTHFKSTGLCLDKTMHYALLYNECVPFENPQINFLSAGTYEIKNNEIILTDQWNQAKIKLIQYKNRLLVTEGFRYLIGGFFEKEKKQKDYQDAIANIENIYYKLFEGHEKYMQSNNETAKILKLGIATKPDQVIEPGAYEGSSVCGTETLILENNDNYYYQITFDDCYPYILLKGTWKQVGNYLVLTDPLSKSSYYIKCINGKLFAGLNIPRGAYSGSSEGYSNPFNLKTN